jgi:hypothetical protein
LPITLRPAQGQRAKTGCSDRMAEGLKSETPRPNLTGALA